MKKWISLVLTVCLLTSFFTLSAFAEIDEYGREMVPVTILTPLGTAISSYLHYGELTEEELAALAQSDQQFIALGAEKLGDPSYSFNCFAFALYSRDVDTQELWLSAADAYVTDGSLVEIDEPVVGCIVLYEDFCNIIMEMNTTTPEGVIHNVYPFGEEVMFSHAGVVVDVERGEDGVISDDEVTVVSKWGMGGLYRHTVSCSPYANGLGKREDLARLPVVNNNGNPAQCSLYREHTFIGVRYFVPNPEAFGGLTLKTDTGAADQQGLYKDAAGDIRFYAAGTAIEAGLVSDADGNYYYIDESLKAVRNTELTISLSHTNGLLPDGTYTVGANGAITELPEIVAGESLRNGVLLLPDGQIKAVENGYPVDGMGVFRLDNDYCYAPKVAAGFEKNSDGSIDFDMMLTDGFVETIPTDELNGLLPVFDYILGEDGRIVNLPTKLDSMTNNFGTGLMRMPDKTIALYENGLPCTDATAYTDPATGITYTFRFGGKTYTTNLPTATIKVTARNALRFR